MENAKWLVVKKLLDIMLLVLMAILSIMFISKNICFMVAAVGNFFCMLWLILGDPLQSGIKLKIGESDKSTFQFFLVALLIWAFAAIFHFTNLCWTFSDMIGGFGKAFVGLG